jgi:anti-sigma regulatory factor (Ser/Thr protein kinase)
MLNNDIREIGASLSHLQAFGDGAQLGPDLQNQMELVFEELVANAVRYGFTPGSTQKVRVRAESSRNALTLVFEDDGAPFNPLDRAPPPALTNIETAPVGGLGIALVKRLSQRLAYEAPEAVAADAFRPVNRLTVVFAR